MSENSDTSECREQGKIENDVSVLTWNPYRSFNAVWLPSHETNFSVEVVSQKLLYFFVMRLHALDFPIIPGFILPGLLGCKDLIKLLKTTVRCHCLHLCLKTPSKNGAGIVPRLERDCLVHA